jgi:hypothetical protein
MAHKLYFFTVYVIPFGERNNILHDAWRKGALKELPQQAANDYIAHRPL